MDFLSWSAGLRAALSRMGAQLAAFLPAALGALGLLLLG